MKKYLLYILVAAFAVKANAQDGFKHSPNGALYKIFTPNTGEKIKVNDIVTFQIVQKTEKDSILYSSYQSGHPAQVQVQPAGDMMDILPLLTLNDSLMVKAPTDSIFKTQEDKRPPFLPKGSYLIFLIKIQRVQSLAEVMAQAKAESEKAQVQESVLADKYIADKKLVYTTTPSGLKYKITKVGVKPKPLNGDTVYVNYVGHTLEGKVFDTSIEAEATKAGLQQPGRVYEPINFALGAKGVIAGWEEALLLLNEGGKAQLFIPSKLAYGASASGPDIKPYSTLIFDIELVKVKRVKHEPPVAAKKPIAKSTVKKPVAKKPVTVKKKQ